jgi:hypothetical protein
VPSCFVCNRLKADLYPDGQTLSFVAPERLEKVRAYLQEIGRWHQESLRRTWEREGVLARGLRAVEALKCYCEQRAQVLDDPHAASYTLLYRRIFGVAWDPTNAFQVQVSLHWQQAHATSQLILDACADAWRFFTAALDQDHDDDPR